MTTIKLDKKKAPKKNIRCRCVMLLRLLMIMLNLLVLLLSRVRVVLLLRILVLLICYVVLVLRRSITWDTPVCEVPSPSFIHPCPHLGIGFAACLSMRKLSVMFSLPSLCLSTIFTQHKKWNKSMKTSFKHFI